MITIQPMTIDIDIGKVIKDLGGPTQVARLCQMRNAQAVSMWAARGHIPQARLIYLQAVRPDVFPSSHVDVPAAPR